MSNNIVLEDSDMYVFFQEKNYEFSDELLSRYYLSLKTKPFVILTGISGTGKTKIAQIFADYMCQDDSAEEKKKRIAFIPVRPDWMDNRGLLGYYNILQEKYIKTPFLDLLLEAEKNPEKPHFIILDEMNLAKVEYYFSDFLSIMESRTQDNPMGEAIPLYDKDQNHDAIVPYEIHISANVYFTGTVNIDESTYMFSPKVLDRANVIEFNQVTLDRTKQKREIDEDKFLLVDSEIIDSLNSEDNQFINFKALKNSHNLPLCSDAIVDLLITMEKYNMHFGYRVANEMARFIILSKSNINKFNWIDALDIQILQKVLPKLHGTRAKLENPIKDLIEFCEKKEFVRSAKKLKSMQTNLEANGYASFIE